MLVIENTFHGTSIRTRKSEAEIESIIGQDSSNRTPAENAWIKKTKRSLCAYDCRCSDEIGRR